MNTQAFVFPGQGSQYVGMGKDFYQQHPQARRRFEEADALLGFSLSAICFEGPEEELRQTRNTQPAIFLHSGVAFREFHTVILDKVAGDPLGQYSALVAAGAIGLADALQLVRLRGELMQRAGEEQRGTMAAIVGLTPDAVREV